MLKDHHSLIVITFHFLLIWVQAAILHALSSPLLAETGSVRKCPISAGYSMQPLKFERSFPIKNQAAAAQAAAAAKYRQNSLHTVL